MTPGTREFVTVFAVGWVVLFVLSSVVILLVDVIRRFFRRY